MGKSGRGLRASDIHVLLVILMLLSIVMVGQQLSKDIYQIGLALLVLSTLVQIAFGNIPGHFSINRAMRLFVLFMSIILLIFFISYTVVPFLYVFGR